MNEPLPPGYSVPVYRSLLKPLLVGGVPQNTAILLVLFGGFAVVGMFLMHRYFGYFLVFELALLAFYRFAVERCKTDPHYFDVAQQNRGPRDLVP
jgi:type IV secretory pathway TrbD component